MLYTLDTGNPSTTPIVFLHGGGLSSKSWQPIIERLPDFHCLAPDLPEQGQSKDISFSLEGAARGVAEIIRQRAPGRKAHVVGHSVGGAITLTLLRLVPDLVDHAIITGSSGRLPRWLVKMAFPLFGISRLMKPENMVQATLRQHGVPTQYHALLHDDLLIASDINFLRRLYNNLTTLELPQEIKQPLLVCVGEKETGFAKKIARDLLCLYPSARGSAMPNGSHVWTLQFPDIFAEMVRAWVTDRPLPPALKPLKT